MTAKKKVLIVEPSVIIVEGLVKILGEHSQIEVLTPLYDIECLKGRIITGKPDILIINPTLLPKSKRQEFNGIKHEYPDITILALVYQYVGQSSLSMYHGIIDICEERAHICEIIIDCCSQQKASTDPQPDENEYELTRRELDVLVQIAKGLMNKEIADKLNISIHTVISHRKNITRKTGIKSVAGLAMYALMNNLMEE